MGGFDEMKSVTVSCKPSLALQPRACGWQFWPTAYLCLCDATPDEARMVKVILDDYDHLKRMETQERRRLQWIEHEAQRKRQAERAQASRAKKRERGELICVTCKVAPVEEGADDHDYCVKCLRTKGGFGWCL